MRILLSTLLGLALLSSGCVFSDKGTPDTVVQPVPVQGGTNTIIEHDKTVTQPSTPPPDANVNVHINDGKSGGSSGGSSSGEY